MRKILLLIITVFILNNCNATQFDDAFTKLDKINQAISDGDQKITAAKNQIDIAQSRINDINSALQNKSLAINQRGPLIAASITAKNALTIAEQNLEKIVNSTNKAALIAARETIKAALKQVCESNKLKI